MSNLASFSIINEKVEKIFSEENTLNKGYAFTYLCLRTLFKLTDEELEETITDWPMDWQVDAIYIDDRTIHLLTFKYTDRFDLSQKNYPETDLDQFILTIDSIISGSLDEKTINSAIWEKYQEIRSLSETGKIEFKIHVVSNKLHPVDTAKIKLKNAIDKYRIVENPKYLDQEDLVSIILSEKVKKIDGQIRFIDKQHFEKSDGNIKSIIGSIAVKDVIELIKLNDNEINEEVFNENVRIYKPKHRVNKAIIESASDENNFQFFYLNNGITILSEEVDYAPNTRSPLAILRNFQIINWWQTSHSLFEVHKIDSEKLDSVEILVRICEVKKDDPISEKISETSNNQIPVGSRDLHSNDLIQRKLEEEFETLGLYYERKPNQHTDKPKNKVYNNEILWQLFMAYHLGLASEAKNNKTKVFSDLYDQIFDEMIISASELIRLNKLYEPLLEQKKEIQKKKRKKEFVAEKEAFISRAIFHIVSATKHLYDKASFEIEQKSISQSEKNKEKERVLKEKWEEFTNEVIDIIFEIVIEQSALRPDLYTHDKFFKEIPTNTIIRDRILEKIWSNGKIYSS